MHVSVGGGLPRGTEGVQHGSAAEGEGGSGVVVVDGAGGGDNAEKYRYKTYISDYKYAGGDNCLCNVLFLMTNMAYV